MTFIAFLLDSTALLPQHPEFCLLYSSRSSVLTLVFSRTWPFTTLNHEDSLAAISATRFYSLAYTTARLSEVRPPSIYPGATHFSRFPLRTALPTSIRSSTTRFTMLKRSMDVTPCGGSPLRCSPRFARILSGTGRRSTETALSASKVS